MRNIVNIPHHSFWRAKKKKTEECHQMGHCHDYCISHGKKSKNKTNKQDENTGKEKKTENKIKRLHNTQ